MNQLSGILQPIVGYHRDDAGDWVAELGCLHFQHVRHNAPWVNREWVLSRSGRQSKIGKSLRCVKCRNRAPPDHTGINATKALRLPSSMISCKTTRIFTESDFPEVMLGSHCTAEGEWVLLHVLSGTLKYCLTQDDQEATYVITSAAPRVIPAGQAHCVIIDEPVSFQLEFFR